MILAISFEAEAVAEAEALAAAGSGVEIEIEVELVVIFLPLLTTAEELVLRNTVVFPPGKVAVALTCKGT